MGRAVIKRVLVAVAMVSAVAGIISASPTSKTKPPVSVDKLISVENVRLHYVEGGTGPAVVLLHGNAGSVEDFRFRALDLLSKNYRVIAIDRPGHGESDRPSSMPSPVDDQAQLIHEALRDLGISRPIIVGHSWGASLALDYALKYPNDLSGLVLLAPAAYPSGGEPKLLRAALKVPLVGDLTFLVGSSLFSRGILKRDLANAFYPEKVPDRYFTMVSSSWLGRKQLRAYIDDELALNEFLNRIKGDYPKISTETVIVTGDDDKVISIEDNALRLHQAIPNSQLIELKDAGHEIPETRPESIAQALDMVGRDQAETANQASAY